MRRPKNRIIAIAFAVTMIIPLSRNTTFSQAYEISSSVGTGLAIDQIADRLQGLIERAEQAGDFLMMRAGQEALYALDGFERANKGILETAFEKIGAERQAVINQINKTADDIEQGRVDTLERLTATSDQIDRLVRATTLNKEPVIFRYRGSIVTPGETHDVRLVINGANLKNGTPHLLFRDQRYDARKEGETLRFELPRPLFIPEESKMKSEDATLVLEGREGGFLGWFTRPVTVKYDLNLVTLPRNIGPVTVTYEKVTQERKERTVSIRVNHNSSRRSWDCRSFTYSPATAERRFDVERSYVNRGSGNRRGKLRDVSIRDVGISFRICAKRGVFDRDNGFRHANGQYVEFWYTPGKEPQTKSKMLDWTSDVVIPVDDKIDRLLVGLEEFTGMKRTATMAGRKVSMKMRHSRCEFSEARSSV